MNGDTRHLVIARRTAREAARPAALWGLVFGVYVAIQVKAYVADYKTPAQRAHLAALFGTNPGYAALVGPAHHIDTVPGFVAWKAFVFLVAIGAVWGLLISTRCLRGEEEAGRWELLCAGPTTPARATAQVALGLAGALFVLWAVMSVLVVAAAHVHGAGITTSGALYFTLSVTAGVALFAAVGACTSQLAATRRQAAGYAGAVLAACYGLRLVGDAGVGASWLTWASPLGWVEELRPLTGSQTGPLVLVGAATGVLVAAAVALAKVRDVGASVVPDRTRARARTALLSNSMGLAVRMTRGVALAWAVAAAALALLFGLIAKDAASALKASPSIVHYLERLGVKGYSVSDFFAYAFLFVAALVAFAGASQVTAARAEESSGRLDALVSRAVSRTGWFSGRAAVAAGVVVVVGVAGGLALWAGAASQGAGVGAGTLAQATANAFAPALCLVGVGLLAAGVVPRATSGVVYGLLAWSLFVDFVGASVNLSHWVLDTSLFHQMALAPAVDPNWTSDAAMVGVGALAALSGCLAFGRRDLAGA